MANINHIQGKGTCIPLLQMMDYIHDRLPVKERNRVERHMLDCELCQEAMEGYMLARDEKRIIVINSHLLKEISGTQSFFTIRRMAAVITGTFILGGGLYFVNQELNKPETAIAQESVKESTSKPSEQVMPSGKMDSAVAIKSFKSSPKDMMRKEQSPSSDGVYGEVITKPWADENSVVGNTSGNDSFSLSRSSPGIDVRDDKKMQLKEEEEIRSVSEEESLMEQDKVAITTSSGPKEKAKGNKSKDKKSANYIMMDEDQMYNKTETTPSTVYGGASMESKAMRVDSLYQSGLNYFNKEEYTKAIAQFDKVLKTSANFEDARWHKSQAFIKGGEKEKAKVLLKEIAGSTSPYKEKAREELKKIE